MKTEFLKCCSVMMSTAILLTACSPKESNELAATQCAVNQYLYASIKLDEAIAADFESLTSEQAIALLDEVKLAYERAEVAAQYMENAVDNGLQSKNGRLLERAFSAFQPIVAYT